MSDPLGLTLETEFDGIYVKFYGKLVKHACRITKNAEFAEDLAQDALITLYNNRFSLNSIVNLDAYLKTTVRNNYRARLRKTREFSNWDEVLADAVGQSFKDLNARLDRDDLLNAIKRLKREERSVVTLIYCEGMSYQEAADCLMMDLATVKNRRISALRQLRVILISPAKFS